MDNTADKIRGQLSKITTTADQSVRLTVDIPYESAGEIMTWLFQMVEINVVGVDNEGNR
jgi:hypothetical protein